jgi:hypothetical protein
MAVQQQIHQALSCTNCQRTNRSWDTIPTVQQDQKSTKRLGCSQASTYSLRYSITGIYGAHCFPLLPHDQHDGYHLSSTMSKRPPHTRSGPYSAVQRPRPLRRFRVHARRWIGICYKPSKIIPPTSFPASETPTTTAECIDGFVNTQDNHVSLHPKPPFICFVHYVARR